MNDPILEMRGVSKSFFGIKALRGVDLTIYAGEIHAFLATPVEASISKSIADVVPGHPQSNLPANIPKPPFN